MLKKTGNMGKKLISRGFPAIKLPKFKDTILMLPNLLTFVRILIVPVVVYFLYREHESPGNFYDCITAWLFILAAMTDFLDGYFARRMGMKSSVGKILDPLADKLMVISILIMLIPLERVSAFLVVIIMAREFIITALRSLASVAGIIIPADKIGKLKTVFQMIAIPALLFDFEILHLHTFKLGLYFLWLSTGFSLSSAYLYMRDFFRAAKDLEF